MNDFARRLKDCREKMKSENPEWTQKYVAEKIGMARTTYTAYENGTKMPPLDTVNNIAVLLDVSNDYLMGRTDEPRVYKERSLAQFKMLPVVTRIVVGEPSYSTKDISSYYPVESGLISDGNYVWLNVFGESMTNVGIRDGSKVLVHLQSTVENGDIAVVCIDGSDAVLRQVYFNNEEVLLVVNGNASFADELYCKKQVKIKGKVIYVSASFI